jgi:hypothetical protein
MDGQSYDVDLAQVMYRRALAETARAAAYAEQAGATLPPAAAGH